MSAKEKTNIYLNKQVKQRAVELGLNLSKVCENALIATIQAVSGVFNGQDPGPGFEPGRQATQNRTHGNRAYRPVEPVAGVQIPSPAPQQSLGAVSVVPFSQPVSGLQLPGYLTPTLLTDFRRFLVVDLKRERLTVAGHTQAMARFLDWLPEETVTKNTIRDYLEHLEKTRPGAYKNELSALKVFFRDFMRRDDLVDTFRFPSKGIELKTIPKKSQVREFYYALEKLELRIAGCYMLYATSGWRRREILALHTADVDLENRILQPRVKSSETKGRLPGFFNEETQDLLRRYLASRRDHSAKLIPITERTFRALWSQAAEACGFMIQPQLLRDWFCEEMGNRKVPDRYIDAFCGRVPKSVLAKHYTDYAPEKLKAIYDRARLKVLA